MLNTRDKGNQNQAWPLLPMVISTEGVNYSSKNHAQKIGGYSRAWTYKRKTHDTMRTDIGNWL